MTNLQINPDPKKTFSIETALSIKHLPAFMVNWCICFKCNLDCSYCTSHDNSMKPVPFETCQKSADFIFKYADLVLSAKQKHQRRLAINFIGGEPFQHPDIVQLLDYVRHQHNTLYHDRFKLSVTMTTNGLIGENMLARALPMIDYWTVSYHTETLDKQKQLTLKNIKTLKESGRMMEVRVMAPADEHKFNEAKQVHEILIADGVNALMKPISLQEYGDKTQYFVKFWNTKDKEQITNYSTNRGVTCCSERPLTLNQDLDQKTNFIPRNNFEGWYCALNWHYLYVNHLQQVYNNSACFVNHLTNNIEPIGTVQEYQTILDTLDAQIKSKQVSVITCPKNLCEGCGMCATKSNNKETFKQLMSHQLNDVSILKL